MCLPGEAWYLHALAAIRTVAAPSAALIEQSLPLGDERRSREVKRRINLLSRSDHGQAQAEQQADYPQRITSIWRREHLQRVDAAGHNQLQFYLNPGPYRGRQKPREKHSYEERSPCTPHDSSLGKIAQYGYYLILCRGAN